MLAQMKKKPPNWMRSVGHMRDAPNRPLRESVHHETLERRHPHRHRDSRARRASSFDGWPRRDSADDRDESADRDDDRGRRRSHGGEAVSSSIRALLNADV